MANKKGNADIKTILSNQQQQADLLKNLGDNVADIDDRSIKTYAHVKGIYSKVEDTTLSIISSILNFPAMLGKIRTNDGMNKIKDEIIDEAIPIKSRSKTPVKQTTPIPKASASINLKPGLIWGGMGIGAVDQIRTIFSNIPEISEFNKTISEITQKVDSLFPSASDLIAANPTFLDPTFIGAGIAGIGLSMELASSIKRNSTSTWGRAFSHTAIASSFLVAGAFGAATKSAESKTAKTDVAIEQSLASNSVSSDQNVRPSTPLAFDKNLAKQISFNATQWDNKSPDAEAYKAKNILPKLKYLGLISKNNQLSTNGLLIMERYWNESTDQNRTLESFVKHNLIQSVFEAESKLTKIVKPDTKPVASNIVKSDESYFPVSSPKVKPRKNLAKASADQSQSSRS
jgi:hypothetical protein